MMVCGLKLGQPYCMVLGSGPPSIGQSKYDTSENTQRQAKSTPNKHSALREPQPIVIKVHSVVAGTRRVSAYTFSIN